MDRERLQKIYRKTDGRCHLCHSKLSFSCYGLNGFNGAWHIEHSIAKANGGTNHLNNLYAACIDCNLDKGVRFTRTIRSQYGVTRAPYSKTKKKKIREENMTVGGAIGGLIGAAFGPLGFLIGVGIGTAIGEENSPRI